MRSAVSDTNPGFVKIGDEIIAYEYINNGSPNWVINILGHNAGTVSGRARDPVTNSGGATGTAHDAGTPVSCYNLGGIPSQESMEHTILLPLAVLPL